MANTLFCQYSTDFFLDIELNDKQGTSLIIGSLFMLGSRLLHDRNLAKRW
jgi:hypothetical protein